MPQELAVAEPTHSAPPSRSIRGSLAALESKQKSSKGAPAYSRFVNRRLGRVLAAVAHEVGATPNAVTAISAACTFAAIAGIALLTPQPIAGMLIALGLVLGYALDSADGQLARLRGGGTRAGEWLDHVVDATKIAVLHLAVAVAFFRLLDDAQAVWLLVPLGFAVVGSVSFFAMTLNDQLRRNSGTDSAAGPRHSSLVRSLLVVPTDYGLLCLVFLLWGWPTAFAAAYSVLFVGCLGFLVLALPKWYRDMRQLDQPARHG